LRPRCKPGGTFECFYIGSGRHPWKVTSEQPPGQLKKARHQNPHLAQTKQNPPAVPIVVQPRNTTHVCMHYLGAYIGSRIAHRMQIKEQNKWKKYRTEEVPRREYHQQIQLTTRYISRAVHRGDYCSTCSPILSYSLAKNNKKELHETPKSEKILHRADGCISRQCDVRENGDFKHWRAPISNVNAEWSLQQLRNPHAHLHSRVRRSIAVPACK